MMRLAKGLLVLGVVVLLVGPALAQPPRGPGRGPGMGMGRGMGGGLGMLLMNKSVQDELKMDKDQVDKVQEAFKKFREDHKEDFTKMFDRNTSQEERAKLTQKMTEEGNKIVSQTLKPDQVKRIKEIRLQSQERFMGPGIFADEEVQKALKLTEDQQDKIKTIAADMRKEAQELFQGGGRPDPEAMKKMQGLQKEAMANANKVLTSDQKKAFKELKGEPFEMKFEGFGPRGDKPRGDRPRGDRPRDNNPDR